MTKQIECTLWDGVEQDAALSRTVSMQVRTAYFAHAGDAALRYRVSVSEVVAHLLSAGIQRMTRPERASDNLRCVIHATALVRHDAQAWADLMNQLAPSFDRVCAARLDPVRGIAFARRFWNDIRECTGSATRRGPRSPDLRGYAGARPLRYWLAERLLGSLEVELARSGRASHGSYNANAMRLDTAWPARTLRIPSQVITAEAKAT